MTFDWNALFRRPRGFTDVTAGGWFERIAQRLLFGSRLVANAVPLRPIEVEAYYHGPGHHDPFAHTDPVQLTPGRWYFHRTGGVYRGGSFKGLDVSFGDGTAYGGFLVRGVELPDGSVVDGPSLTVDHLLTLTAHTTVSALDAAIAERLGWVEGVPVQLLAVPEEGGEMLRCVRVGLSLRKRKYTPDDTAFPFLFRSYRYLSEPKRTAKGKPHMALPLLANGYTAEQVRAITGSPVAAVRRYAADFAAGRLLTDPAPFYGRELTTKDLCRLYGLWWERHGRG